jgi:Ala-tRNA(Pro) deacylase
MAIALTLEEYLKNNGIEYEVIPHRPTTTTMASAEVAHIPGDQVAKSVVLEDDNGYLMVVLPTTHYVELGNISRQLNRRLGLATEDELAGLFYDCELGSIPPVGEPYGVEVLMDESLGSCPDVYFESGDHSNLIHVSGREFRELLQDVQHGQFSYHM